ncbi:MAG: glutamate--tRNA ligase [Acidobacteria bacterium]|nr:glutamate--tRNA ligase [Acidobacteriota bacterium]
MMRVRFAPSPTGYLHIGSARTFIFNWLFARKHHGTMILRIDDTDVDRNTDASLQSIYDGLNWLGLGWDEHYRQSERLDLHKRLAYAIFEKDLAYRDFTPAHASPDDPVEAGADTPKQSWQFNPGMRELSREESDRRAAAGEPFVLRYRVPRGVGRTIRFADGVYGPQAKEADDIEDFALLRSSGLPTYHMASCADDADLGITNIIRGQDHLSNTFKHVLIFEALGSGPAPEFAHLPLLIAPDGAKLSKRKHGPVVSVTTYRDAGFLPHAYINFLCLLGWSPKNDREQMTRQELIDAFTLSGVNRSNAVITFTDADPIDPKALWLNSQTLRTVTTAELAPLVRQTLAAAGLAAQEPPERLEQTIEILRSRFATLLDFAGRGRCCFADDYPVAPEAEEKLNVPQARELLRELGARLEADPDFTEASVEKQLRGLATERGVKAGVLINGSRAALTGQTAGPSAFAVYIAVGRERAIQRLKKV